MKDKIVRIIKILISLFLMYLLFHQVNYRELKDALRNVRADGILIVIIVYMISVVINAVKWYVLLPDTEILFLIGLSFRAQLYSTVLPGQLFGEASKITAWTDCSDNLSNVTASVIFDKITSLIAQILIGIVGVYSSSKAVEIGNKWSFILFVAVSLFLIYISSERHVSITIRKMIFVVGKLSHRLEEKCLAFYDAWCLFSVRKSILFKSVFWGIINQLAGIFSVWYLSSSIGLEISLLEYCWIISMMSVILLLPVSFAGVGLRDTSMASMLSLFNVSVGDSLVLSMTLLLAQIMAAGIGGIYTLRTNLQKNSSGNI